ncbi:MAG: transposase family protein [Desulfobacteraceae bacterium]|nr:transposase family protein [Desulfobacteraceae bacterium]
MQTTIMTANAQNIKLEGPADVPCVSCAIRKARKKRISKQNLVSRSKIPGERLFLNISSQKISSLGGNMHWLLVLDDCTDNGFSFFLKEKSQTSEVMIPFLKLLERHFGKGVKYIRCDNSGENTALQKECVKAGLGIGFEFTAPNTPQQNGRVERKFTTLWGHMRAMMAGSNFP